MNHADYAYEPLAQALADAGIVASLAELHGGLCGVMCIGGITAADRWLEQCLGESQPHLERELGETLRRVEIDAWRTLSGSEMGFQPLLPGDDEPLEAQVEALAMWCHGFLAGLGVGGLDMAGQPQETAEALSEITKDFAEISRATLSAEDAKDPGQAGFALAELKEYVRVSVQLVFERFGGGESAAHGAIH